MNDPIRYSRQTVLKEFGAQGQKRLKESKVLVVGAGGLGVPVLTYLNAMGVGTLGIVDNDTVSLSNLHRQVLYDEATMGKPKVEIALRVLAAQNSDTDLIGYSTFLEVDNALQIIRDFDIVVDASDNFPTRYLINDACVILKKPLVYGALHGFEGHVSVFNYKDGPTYRCLFPNMPGPKEIPDCNVNGILGILPGIIGNFQALEVVKALTGIGEVMSGKLLIYNGLSQSIQKIKFPKTPVNTTIRELKPNYGLECAVQIQTVDADTFWKQVANENIQCIDVRTPQEFEAYHLPNTLNLPLDEIQEGLGEIQFNKPVYFLCQSGLRSQRAVSQIAELYPEARLINVTGGINNLQAYVAQ